MFTRIQALQETGFWRCGVFHSFEGEVHAQDAFSKGQWDILKNEKMLKLTETDEKPTKKPSNDAELIARVVGAIEVLDHEGFTKTGKPKIAAVRDLLEDDKDAITSDVLDEAFAVAKSDDFEVPEAPAN